MPTVREIEQALFALAPFELAMGGDNVGHLLGDPEQEVDRVLVALDITEDVAAEAIDEDCQLIVAHHPVMNCKWLPVQSVRSDRPQGHLLLQLLRNYVSAICMHTNLACTAGGVNDVLAARLELEDVETPDPASPIRIGNIDEPVEDLRVFVDFVCGALGCNGVRFADAGKPVYRVAVGGGACGDFEDDVIAAGCDTFVTADLSYHQFLDAKGKGINLIDAGHFPTEDPVCELLIAYLTEQFPELTVMKAASHKEVVEYYIEGEK